MKKFKHYALLLLLAITVFGCSKDYDDTALKNDISDLKSRVEKLETWCTTVNGQISALQGLVTALEAKDYVTGVSPVENGYTITFSKSGTITIYNGKDGANGTDGITPAIGAAKDTDGLYYWTIKVGDAEPTWMLDADGKKVRTTGATAPAPQISVATDTDGKVYWKVNGEWLMSGGQKVQATGDKGDTGASGPAGAAGKDGDSIFKKDGIDLTDPNSVTFTLNDGKDTKITLPRTGAMTIFDSFDEIEITNASQPTEITLTLNIKQDGYAAIKAEITSTAGTSTAITRATLTPWEVSITAPVFGTDGTISTQPVVSLTPKDGNTALLKVTVVDEAGKEHSATRVLNITTFANENEAGIDGSSWDKAYEISNLKQFKLLATRVNMDNSPWTTKYYKLTADIDFGADNTETWPAIGCDYQHAFKGHFDGGNHIVKGKLNISATYIGIFGIGIGAEIRNLHFRGTINTLDCSHFFVAAIIASDANAAGLIVNCSNTADITSTENTGGIVAQSKGKVIACVNSGNLTGDKDDSVFGIGDANCIGCINKGAIAGGAYVTGIGYGALPIVACWSSAATLQYSSADASQSGIGAILGNLLVDGSKACYWKEIAGINGVGKNENGKTVTDFASFTGDLPTTEQIAKMNAAWAEAQPTGREYQFNATTGEIEEIP